MSLSLFGKIDVPRRPEGKAVAVEREAPQPSGGRHAGSGGDALGASGADDTALADLIVCEAHALAIRGKIASGLRLLEGASQTPAVRLARARLLLARGRDVDIAAARELLEALSEHPSPAQWRVRVELSRVMRHEHEPLRAAELLEGALKELRASSETLGVGAQLLAPLVSDEVRALTETPPAMAVSDDSIEEAAERRGGAVSASALLQLIELGRRLAGEPHPDRVLELVLQEAVQLFTAERGFVARAHEHDVQLVAATGLNATTIEEPEFALSQTLVREVTRSRRPRFLSLSDLQSEDTLHASLARRGVQSVACVPIVGDHATLGVLYLDRSEDPDAFQRRNRRLLELFAVQAASALQAAENHREQSLALESAQETIRRHRAQAERRERYSELIGTSKAMETVFERMDVIVPTELSVVINGETGTGKDVVARLIHSQGPRARSEFVAINCAGLAEELLEAELFGHDKGAFTGADRPRAGLFEVANGGTLFLDEVGDMSARMQGDLLRVLQSGELRRVGGRRPITVDVRVIAATHRDLAELVREGTFREDLYYRLNVLTLHLPPLRERDDDVPLIAAELLRRFTTAGDPPELSEGALKRLSAFHWPGNVRQLENVLRRLAVLGGATIGERDVAAELPPTQHAPPRARSLREAEDAAVRAALEAAGGNKAKAARILGVDRKTLYAKLKRLSET